MESNLSALIEVIAEFDLSRYDASTIAPFEIEAKIDSNGLTQAAGIVRDYAIYNAAVAAFYAEFDNAGMNKSRSVLSYLRSKYLRLAARHSGDELYFELVDELAREVRESSNAPSMPIEEMDMWLCVITVDAFVRCKIFAPPKERSRAAT